METIEFGTCQVCHSRCDSRSECFQMFQTAKLHDEEDKNRELLAIEQAKIDKYWDAVEAKIASDTRNFYRLMRAAAAAIIVVCVASVLVAMKASTFTPKHGASPAPITSHIVTPSAP